jgi:hypothetical protein
MNTYFGVYDVNDIYPIWRSAISRAE